MQFLDAISSHLSESLLADVQNSLVFSILEDKGIDWTLKPYLIIYIIYLNEVEFMSLVRGTREYICGLSE